MTLNSLLLKIETGQPLGESHEKKLAKKLWLVPSFSRTVLHVVLVLLAFLMVLLGVTDSLKPLPSIVSYLISVVLIGLLIYVLFVPRSIRLSKYFSAVDTFYETKFAGLEHFDLYYIGQHKSPHVKALRSSKIYLLSNHQQLIFIDDYFKDTEYKLPKVYGNGSEIFLRVLDPTKNDQSRLSISISEIDYFHLSSDDIVPTKKPRNKKYIPIFQTFLDQDPRMDDYHFITLKLLNGAVFRISYDAYSALKNAIPLRER